MIFSTLLWLSTEHGHNQTLKAFQFEMKKECLLEEQMRMGIGVLHWQAQTFPYLQFVNKKTLMI